MLKDVKETASWERNKGKFSVIEVPAVIISIETFVNLQKDAERILGVDGASILLYETGKKAAMQWIYRFNNEWGLKDKKFIEAVQNFYAELGWGNFVVEEDNKNGLVIRVENSFIARGYGNSDVPVCHFLRGYNAGLAQVLKGNEIGAEEVKCAAKGDDCCEFVMKRMI
ncbi:MAG: V4R domain-containing protein [Candidatus Methanoperedens sp.]|nr:V4R domain-containing protein [Candidatus Methanoperedens sp.]